MKLCNLTYLNSISPDNTEFVRDMILLFLKNVRNAYEEMNASLITSDWNLIHEHAHKLKSHFDCVGLPQEFRETAKQIEEYTQQHNHLELIPGLLKKLETETQQAFKELEEELKKNPV